MPNSMMRIPNARNSRLMATRRIRPFRRGDDPAGGFTPQSMFANGEDGFYYEPSPTTCWQESTKTTPSAVGDPVGYLEDQSGNGNHATQATSAARPTLRQLGDKYYLEFDGVDDNLEITGTPLSAWGTSDGYAVDATWQDGHLSASRSNLLGNFGGAADAFANTDTAPYNSPQNIYNGFGRTVRSGANGAWTFGENFNMVFEQISVAAGQTHYVDGTQVGAAHTGGSQGWNAGTLYIGETAGGHFNPAKGRSYALFLIDREPTAEERTNMRGYMADNAFPDVAQELFASGEDGCYMKIHPDTCWQESTKTTPSAVGDPVGYVEDLSGNGNHATQTTSAARPTLRQDGSSYYLEFDGTDDHMDLPSNMMSGWTDGHGSSMVRYDDHLTTGRSNLLANMGTGTGAANLDVVPFNDGNVYSGFGRTARSGSLGAWGILDGVDAYVEHAARATGLSIYRDGTIIGTEFSGGAQGWNATPTLGHSPTFSYPTMNGRAYGWLMIDRDLTAQERTDLQTFMEGLKP